MAIANGKDLIFRFSAIKKQEKTIIRLNKTGVRAKYKNLPEAFNIAPKKAVTDIKGKNKIVILVKYTISLNISSSFAKPGAIILTINGIKNSRHVTKIARKRTKIKKTH